MEAGGTGERGAAAVRVSRSGRHWAMGALALCWGGNVCLPQAAPGLFGRAAEARATEALAVTSERRALARASEGGGARQSRRQGWPTWAMPGPRLALGARDPALVRPARGIASAA